MAIAPLLIPLVLLGCAGLLAHVLVRRSALQELRRFDTPIKSAEADQRTHWWPWLQERIRRGDFIEHYLRRAEEEKRQKYSEAGLEDESQQERYMYIRAGSLLFGPTMGALSFLYVPPYYATIATIVCVILGIVIPMLYLKVKITERSEAIQRELPMLLDLTNLGTSAGWDISTSLDLVVNALAEEMPNHPLIREFKRGVYLTQNGSTWDEALQSVSQRLGTDIVRRATLALVAALRHGGERVGQLEAIAEDAQRTFYSTLDKRLAGLPVKTLLVTMMLMIGYFVILLSPALIHIKGLVLG